MKARRCSNTWRPCPLGHDVGGAPFRLPIQRVIRPDQDYRGFAGQIASGSVWPGDRVVALPSGRTSRVKSITTFDGDLARAVAPMSIALTLEDELDISRGEMLAAAHQPPAVAANFLAALVWMDAQPLDSGKSYLLKHTSQTVKARVKTIRHRVNMQTLDPEPAATLELNSIGVVEVETTRPLFLDPYAAQPPHRQLHPDRPRIARDRGRRHGARDFERPAGRDAPWPPSPVRDPELLRTGRNRTASKPA